MKTPQGKGQEKGAIELAEEAVHLLRTAPPAILARYYVGTLPFVLAFLYFWADMGHNAFAYGRVALSSLGLALLFVWMKAWQSFFARRLRECVAGEEPRPWSPGRALRIAAGQAWLHCTGLLVLPAAALILAPFGAAYALYQNLTVLDDGEAGPRELLRAAVAQARLWPRQNHMLIWLLSPFLVVFAGATFLLILPVLEFTAPVWTEGFLGLYSLILALILLPLSPFGTIVAVNLGSVLFVIPMLLRMLLGVETAFTISPASMLNPTFFMIVCGLAYLCMDPLMKAAYVLRCYYGQSLNNAHDLLAELEQLRRAATALVLAVAALGALLTAAAPVAAQSVDSAEVSGATPAQLNEALDRVLERRIYAWRMPRVVPEEKDGWFETFMMEVNEGIARAWRAVVDWLGSVLKWIQDRFPEGGGGGGLSLSGMETVLRVTLYLLVAALAVLVLVFAWKAWRRRIPEAVAARVVAADTPDLEEEDTTAGELPESGWLTLGRELAEGGELRLAMRAFFFAGLARLAQGGLVVIARHKSNRDYARELGRISHEEPELLGTFARGVRAFESVWYGLHEVSSEGLRSFAETQERLRPLERRE